MHVVEIYDELSIIGQVEVLRQDLDNESLLAYFRRLHVPDGTSVPPLALPV
jgi:hypothetical protein